MILTTALSLLAKESALLKPSEAAVLANITPWWVRQLINRGELRAINVGGDGTAAQWRIDPEDLRAWMAARENRPRDLTREAV